MDGLSSANPHGACPDLYRCDLGLDQAVRIPARRAAQDADQGLGAFAVTADQYKQRTIAIVRDLLQALMEEDVALAIDEHSNGDVNASWCAPEWSVRGTFDADAAAVWIHIYHRIHAGGKA